MEGTCLNSITDPWQMVPCVGALGAGSWMEIGAGKKIRSVYWNWHHWTWIKLTTEMGFKKKKQAKGRGSKIQTYRKTKIELKVQMIWKDIKKRPEKRIMEQNQQR